MWVQIPPAAQYLFKIKHVGSRLNLENLGEARPFQGRQVPPAAQERTKEYQNFALKLKNACLEAGLTQVEAAKKLKRPQSYISKSEAGEQRLDIMKIKKYNQPFKSSYHDQNKLHYQSIYHLIRRLSA